MNLANYRLGLGIIGTGVILWIVGLLIAAFVPALAPVGAVLVTVGQVLFWLGIVLAVIQVLISLVRGSGL
jgi:hypothetical protein